MANIGSISVNLIAKTGRFIKGMRGAEKNVKKFGRTSKAARANVAALGASLGGLVTIGAATAGLANAVKSVDQLAKASQKLGLTTEALSGLQFAAKLTGVQTNTLNMAIQRMTRRLSEAAMDTGEAKGALIELGLSAKELNKLAPDKAFGKIAEAMSKVTTQSDRVRLSFKLFDSEGVALVNTLALGESGLAKAAKQAKLLGAVVSKSTAKDLEELSNTAIRLGAAMQGVFIKAGEGLAALGAIAEAIKLPEIIAGVGKVGSFLGGAAATIGFGGTTLSSSLAPGLGGSANTGVVNEQAMLDALNRIAANTGKDNATRP